MARRLIDDVRDALAREADPAKAPAMQAYMRSELPFLGVQTAGRERVFRDVFGRHVLVGFGEWHDSVLSLWHGARYREERYAALALAEDRRYRELRTIDALPLYEELVMTGAWWDYVDRIAPRLLRELLEREPRPAKRAMRAWSRSNDLWKRRSAIICQVGLRERTDARLLYACVAPSLDRKEVWLRRAIGWGLREYAKARPDEVACYLELHGARLSPLSFREVVRGIAMGRGEYE
jgi:3-methyladenine DNA glycosylase AlkD